MDNTKNKSKLITSVIIIVLVVLGAVYFTYSKKNKVVDIPINTVERVDESDNNIIEVKEPVIEKPNPENLSLKQQQVLADLIKAANKEDYVTFADNLKIVYENQWENKAEFNSVESELYKKADTKYFVAGDYDKMLEISGIVFAKVPSSWRFPYLRILTFQRLGINAYEKGDLVTAENMAMEILKMKYRPEGANLLADVYISKINTNIKDGNTELAKNNLGYIWDYQISEDRRNILIDLKKSLDSTQ